MGLESTGFKTLGLYYPDALKEALRLSPELELSPVTLSSVSVPMLPCEERQNPGFIFFLNSKIEAEPNPVQTEPSDRRGMAAEKLCQAPLKFQAGDRRVEAASGGDRSSLVPSRQHRELPDKELGPNGGPREGRLCSQAGPVSEPSPGTPEEPYTNGLTCCHEGHSSAALG